MLTYIYIYKFSDLNLKKRKMKKHSIGDEVIFKLLVARWEDYDD